MDSRKFKKLLFDVACCAVACDYEVAEKEVQELREISKTTTYFKDIDLSGQLDVFLADFKGHEEERIQSLMNQIKEASLSSVQALLILEITLRLIYSDVKINENEIEFLRSVRSVLPINDDLIEARFGRIQILVNSEKIISTEKSKPVTEFKITSTDFKNIENIYAPLENKDKK